MNKFPRADKKLGQHFLTDQTTIDKIIQDYPELCDMIVEVGPGPGVLTQGLAKYPKELNLIEKDTRFCDKLAQWSPNIYNIDALEFQWEDFLRPYQQVWLVSNLPYNVGTPLFILFLQQPQIKYMTLMFQKEVGEKTYLRQEKNSMNGLLVLCSIFFESKLIRKVSPGCFTPPPKVDSVVISYQRRERPEFALRDFSRLDRYCRIIFSNRRKQLRTVLKSALSDIQREELSNDLLSKRAEALTLTEVYSLLRYLLKSQI